MKRLFIVIIIALSNILSCSENEDTPLETPTTNTTGLFTQTLPHDGITREYVIYVPDSYDGTSEVPLMLNFHGYGGGCKTNT